MAHAGVSVKNLYPHQQVRQSDGSSTNYPLSSQLVLHQHEIDTTYVASTATEAAFASGGFVDVRIPAQSTGIITHMTLELRVKAGSGGCNQHPVPFLLAIERVEVLAEAGNILVSSHTPTQLMHPCRHLPKTAVEMLQGPMLLLEHIIDLGQLSGFRPWQMRRNLLRAVVVVSSLDQHVFG